jgi:hypothetical protein
MRVINVQARTRAFSFNALISRPIAPARNPAFSPNAFYAAFSRFGKKLSNAVLSGGVNRAHMPSMSIRPEYRNYTLIL